MEGGRWEASAAPCSTSVQSLSGLWQSMHEIRQYVQATLVQNIVYYGSIVIGVMIGAAGGSSRFDISIFSSYAGLIFLLVLINKTCAILTATPTQGNSQVVAPTGNPVLSPTKNKTLYVIVSWIQKVTEVVIAQVPAGGFYGLFIGKAISIWKRA